jgi:hypothetical protein
VTLFAAFPKRDEDSTEELKKTGGCNDVIGHVIEKTSMTSIPIFMYMVYDRFVCKYLYIGVVKIIVGPYSFQHVFCFNISLVAMWVGFIVYPVYLVDRPGDAHCGGKAVYILKLNL